MQSMVLNNDQPQEVSFDWLNTFVVATKIYTTKEPMFLFSFPSTVSYDDQDMTLNWLNSKPVVLSDGIDIPGYTLQDTQWSSDTEDFTTGNKRLYCRTL